MEDNRETNILIAGVGGQGNILASKILAEAAQLKGIGAIVGEVYGESQRGGSVASHVRLGADALGPLCPERAVRIICGLEPMETLRAALVYAHPEGSIVVNIRKRPPVGVTMGKVKYPSIDEILRALEGLCRKLLAFDATGVAETMGAAMMTNVVMLGAVSTDEGLGLGPEVFEEAISRCVPKDTERNVRAFQAGRKAGGLAAKARRVKERRLRTFFETRRGKMGKKIVDLTMHIYEGMGIGRVFPEEQEFIIEDAFNYEDHGVRVSRFIMWQEPGTRLNLGSISAKRRHEKKLDEIDLHDFYEKDTVILDIPKNGEEPVTAEDIETAFDKVDYRKGDWVVAHTGWGDHERYFRLGDDYALKSPYFSPEACKRLAEIMSSGQSKLFGYDTASMGHPDKYIIPEWCNRKPRPKGWPSEEAREYLRNYTPQKLLEDWGGVMPLPQAGILILGGLTNLAALTGRRVKLTVLPLKIKGVGGGPCRVVAVEDQLGREEAKRP